MFRFTQLAVLACAFLVASSQASAAAAAAVDSETHSLLLAFLGALGLAVLGEPRPGKQRAPIQD